MNTLFEEDIEVFKNRAVVPPIAITLETLTSEHSEILVLEGITQSTVFSLSTLDNLDWWMNDVQKFIISRGKFTFPHNVDFCLG